MDPDPRRRCICKRRLKKFNSIIKPSTNPSFHKHFLIEDFLERDSPHVVRVLHELYARVRFDAVQRTFHGHDFSWSCNLKHLKKVAFFNLQKASHKFSSKLYEILFENHFLAPKLFRSKSTMSAE
jgi:hypothetical protein